MKRIDYNLLLLLLSLMFTGCYEDKGNYDYTSIPEIKVEIETPDGGFYVKFGERLTIPATLTTEFSESEFEFQWEVWKGAVWADGKFNKFAEGKDLDHTFLTDDYFLFPSAYSVRMVATHRSTDMVRYSDVITINVTAGNRGLLVAHHDGTQSDIGFIVAPEFQMTAMEIETHNTPGMYSWVNGSTIPGKITQVIHSYPQNTAYDYQDIIVITDNGKGEVLDNADLRKKADYQSLFLDGFAGTTNQGIAERYYVYNRYKIVIDGGDLFYSQSANIFDIRCLQLDGFDLHPGSVGFVGSYGIMFFDNTKRGFYLGDWLFLDYAPDPMSYTAPEGEEQLFNPADMQADLIHFETGAAASNNFLGVFHGDGEKFIAHLDVSSGRYPRGKYNCAGFTDFDNAKFYAFGRSTNTCYYATGSTVYQFLASTISTTSTPLQMTDASPVPITGEITMMKVLKPYIGSPDSRTAVVTYQHYGTMLLVGTYENGNGKLYALLLDELSGRVASYTVYDGFGRITDANIKGS